MPVISSLISKVLPSNDTTRANSVTIRIALASPLQPGMLLIVVRTPSPTLAAITQISPLQYQFIDRLSPGTYTYVIEITDGTTELLALPQTITVAAPNCAWSPTVSQDGPYVAGARGNHSSFNDDINWQNDFFWLGALNVGINDVVEWQTSWVPGSDGISTPPTLIEHAATITQPRRLEIRPRFLSGGSAFGYASGILSIQMLVNSTPVGDVLGLVLSDFPAGYERASWAIFDVLNEGLTIELSGPTTIAVNQQDSYFFLVTNNDTSNTTATNIQVSIDFGTDFTIVESGDTYTPTPTGLVITIPSLAAGASYNMYVTGSYQLPGQRTVAVNVVPDANYPVENITDNSASQLITITL